MPPSILRRICITAVACLLGGGIPAAHAKGTLVFCSEGSPEGFQPQFFTTGTTFDAASVPMFNRLVQFEIGTTNVVPGLAQSWTVSAGGRRYTLQLRRGLRFSDGLPFDADDVLFTFQVYLDENTHAPQRDLLIVGGKPIVVRKTDPQTIAFQMSKPYGAGERLFDGMIDVLHTRVIPRIQDEFARGQAGFSSI